MMSILVYKNYFKVMLTYYLSTNNILIRSIEIERGDNSMNFFEIQY